MGNKAQNSSLSNNPALGKIWCQIWWHGAEISSLSNIPACPSTGKKPRIIFFLQGI
jgi:hypothetical protein